MILPLIILTLAVASFILVATIKSSGKELMMLTIILATFAIHSTNMMFIDFDGGSENHQMMVDTSFMILYLAQLFIFQEAFLSNTKNLAAIILAGVLSSLAFAALNYFIYIKPSDTLPEITKMIRGCEFILMIILTQRLWLLSLQLKKVSEYLNRIIQLFKTISLVILAPFVAPVITYIFPFDGFLFRGAPGASVNSVVFILEIITLSFLINRLYSLKDYTHPKALLKISTGTLKTLLGKI